MSQRTEILAHLKKHGRITPMQALRSYGCFRLADVIYRLRGQGWPITTRMVENKNTGGQYAQYWMKRGVKREIR